MTENVHPVTEVPAKRRFDRIRAMKIAAAVTGGAAVLALTFRAGRKSAETEETQNTEA